MLTCLFLAESDKYILFLPILDSNESKAEGISNGSHVILTILARHMTIFHNFISKEVLDKNLGLLMNLFFNNINR